MRFLRRSHKNNCTLRQGDTNALNTRLRHDRDLHGTDHDQAVVAVGSDDNSSDRIRAHGGIRSGHGQHDDRRPEKGSPDRGHGDVRDPLLRRDV
ncbi:hypothetical protein D3C78_1034410 [compost metagenome]